MKEALKLYVFKLFFASETCRFCCCHPFARKLSFPKNRRRHSSGGNDKTPHHSDPSREGPVLRITVIVRDDPHKEP